MEFPESDLTNGWDPVETFSSLRIWTYFRKSKHRINNDQTNDVNITQIWPKYNPQMTQIWTKYDLNMTHKWSKYDPQIRPKYDPQMHQMWSKYAPNMTHTWFKYDPNMAPNITQI